MAASFSVDLVGFTDRLRQLLEAEVPGGGWRIRTASRGAMVAAARQISSRAQG